MPTSRKRKGRGEGPKIPELADLMNGHATLEFGNMTYRGTCGHCGGRAHYLVTVRAKGRAWPVPSCRDEGERLKQVVAYVQGGDYDQSGEIA